VVATSVTTAARAASMFSMADASTLVVRGTVRAVTPYEGAKLTVFQVDVGRALKGDVAAGEGIALAQEMLFPTTQPYFAAGVETLVFAVPLPNYSAFRKVLPEGRYWRWPERLDGPADVAPFADPALTDTVARYLAVRDDGEAAADFLVAQLVGPSPRLRADALTTLEQRRELQPLLDTARLARLKPWLADDHQPLPERAQVLVRLARLRAPGVVDVAQASANGGPLQPAAVDALVSLDQLPPADRLLAWAGSSDEALRVAASRGLVKIASPAAFAKLGELLDRDPSDNVRLAILQALGGVDDDRAVALLAAELGKTDKARISAAAESLARIKSDAAIAALGAALEKGTTDAQAAAAFGLKRSGMRRGTEILKEQESSHPDPAVRRLCKLALGEDMHEH
jgi:HEAT repeat protein